MALKIQNGRQVQLAYRLTDTNGLLLEERTPENVYEYVQGQGQILPALENVLNGRTAGFRSEMQLTAREAYGEYDQDLVAEVPRAQVPMDAGLTIGMKFSTQGPSGQAMVVRVISIDSESVTLDGNHPLAGLDLIFELRVLDVIDLAVDSDVDATNELHSESPSKSPSELHSEFLSEFQSETDIDPDHDLNRETEDESMDQEERITEIAKQPGASVAGGRGQGGNSGNGGLLH